MPRSAASVAKACSSGTSPGDRVDRLVGINAAVQHNGQVRNAGQDRAAPGGAGHGRPSDTPGLAQLLQEGRAGQPALRHGGIGSRSQAGVAARPAAAANIATATSQHNPHHRRNPNPPGWRRREVQGVVRPGKYHGTTGRTEQRHRGSDSFYCGMYRPSCKGKSTQVDPAVPRPRCVDNPWWSEGHELQ